MFRVSLVFAYINLNKLKQTTKTTEIMSWNKVENNNRSSATSFAKNENGDTAVYPPVEMVFDPRYNLVDYLISPADLSEEQIEFAGKSKELKIH